MELFQIGAASARKKEDAVYISRENSEVWVVFRNVGLGSEKTSDFRIEIDWDDVSKLMEEFASMKHPKAIELLDARSLGIPARRIG
jgi:hypothetical protein